MAFKTRSISVPLFRPDPTAPFARWSGRALAPDEQAIILALEKQRVSHKPIRLLVNRDDRDADRVSALLADYLNYISPAKPPCAKPRPVKGYGPSERSERLSVKPLSGYGPSERLSPASEASPEPGSESLDEIFPFEILDLRRPPSPAPRVLYKTYNVPDFESESNPTRSSFFPLLIYSYRLEKPIEAKLA